ncbi:hypothetical protein ACFLU3_02135 [Chloroflexota bacterium]
MNKISIILCLIIVVFVFCSGCTSSGNGSDIYNAKPYEIIVFQANTLEEVENRTVGHWTIIADEATTSREFVQTAIKAVRYLYQIHQKDFTGVLLVPSIKSKYSGASYADASYAADGKGPLGMTGSAPAIEGYWKVWISERLLTETELAITELWSEKQLEFPSTNWASSLSYDEVKLKEYIAETLNLPYSEVQLPQLRMTEYEVDESFDMG